MFTSTASLAANASAAQAVAAHWAGPGSGFGFGWFLLIVPLFWILLLVVLLAVARRRWASNGGPAGFASAHAVRGAESTLAERFAHGDIDEVEYRARLEVLRANRLSR